MARRTTKKITKQKLGLNILRAVRGFKESSGGISSAITKVLHEMEGKLLRATGIVRRSRRRRGASADAEEE